MGIYIIYAIGGVIAAFAGATIYGFAVGFITGRRADHKSE